MPSSQDTAPASKRPSLTSRHSSSSTNFARSPGDALSSSAQKQHKPQRHVVSHAHAHAHARLSARVPSFVKSANKLTKLTAVHDEEGPTSPRPSSIKRNSTTATLAPHPSNAGLRKNHSETSLKKNRSSGQLVALTKLTKAHSHKNVTKLGRADGKVKRNSSQLKPHDVPHPTVRFDLGEEEGQDDEWTEESSPVATRDNTRPSSMVAEQAADISGPIESEHEASNEHSSPAVAAISPTISPTSQIVPMESLAVSPTSHAEYAKPESLPSPDTPPPATPQTIPRPSSDKSYASRHADADRITSRLLNRNVSFTVLSKVSEVSAPATVIGDGHKSRSSLRSQNSTLNENTGTELVSRFVNGASTSATPRETSFLPARYEAPEDEDHAGMLRNMSTPNITRAQSRANVKGAATGAPLVMPPSRTQQKMWLERASSTIEPQQRPMRVARLGSGFPFHTVGGEGGIHPILRSQFEQTDVEYKRIRMYQNPLADAVARLQKSGALPKPKITLKPVGRSALSGVDAKPAPAATDPKVSKPANSNTPVKRAKVTFQGITSDGPDSRRSSNDDDERAKQKDEAREICRRLWERHDGAVED